MFWQCPVLDIQALTTLRGVTKPLAMFSPAADQTNPVAEIRAAKFAPWLKKPSATIVLVHPWAERSSLRAAASGGR
jgi:hypothetical protein